jgi:hypothetical protein
MNLLLFPWHCLRAYFGPRSHMLAEMLALRQQLAIYHRKQPRPKLCWRDRFFWVWLSRLWSGWRSALVIVKPETVIRWHRQGFKYYWRWKSGKPGRPRIAAEVRCLTAKRFALRSRIGWNGLRTVITTRTSVLPQTMR